MMSESPAPKASDVFYKRLTVEKKFSTPSGDVASFTISKIWRRHKSHEPTISSKSQKSLHFSPRLPRNTSTFQGISCHTPLPSLKGITTTSEDKPSKNTGAPNFIICEIMANIIAILFSFLFFYIIYYLVWGGCSAIPTGTKAVESLKTLLHDQHNALKVIETSLSNLCRDNLLIFSGGTGVGKTFSAKIIADELSPLGEVKFTNLTEIMISNESKYFAEMITSDFNVVVIDDLKLDDILYLSYVVKGFYDAKRRLYTIAIFSNTADNFDSVAVMAALKDLNPILVHFKSHKN